MNQYIIICSSRKYPYRPSPSHWGHFCFRPPHPWNFHDLPAWLGTPKREYFHPQCTSRTLANSKVTVSCSTGQLRDYYLTNLTCSPLKKSSKSHHHPSEMVSFWIPPPPSSSVLNWCCPPMGEGYFLELHYIQSICRYHLLLEISYFFRGDEGKERF